jgi:hypothetical protein
VPLNFPVTADLRRRFRMFAAAHDLLCADAIQKMRHFPAADESENQAKAPRPHALQE